MSAEENRPLGEESPQAPNPPPRQRKSRKKAKASLFTYLAIMLAAVIVLLMLSYAMQQRKNAETLSGINESMAGLKESVSAMQTIEDIREENQALKSSLADLEEENAALTQQLEEAKAGLEAAQKSQEAGDWLWRMEQLYNTRYYTACRAMMEVFEEAGLKEALSTQPTQEGEPSALEEYERLYDSLH